MIDPDNERLITLNDVCRMFPGPQGKGLSRSTVWRWILHGRRGHKLESLMAGGQRCTSREAVARFLAALNPEEASREGSRRSAEQSIEDQHVSRELDALGL
jgi:hypothetical protein